MYEVIFKSFESVFQTKIHLSDHVTSEYSPWELYTEFNDSVVVGSMHKTLFEILFKCMLQILLNLENII